MRAIYGWVSGHARGLAGFALFAPSLWRWLREAFGWFGDADLVISKYNDPGWVAVMFHAILDPPPWLYLPMIIAGLGLIYWDGIRHRRSSAASSQSDHFDEVKNQETDVPPSQAQEPLRFVPTPNGAFIAAVPPGYDHALSGAVPMTNEERRDAALHAMFDVLIEVQHQGYEIARHVPAEIKNTVNPFAMHGVSYGVQRLDEADRGLVSALQRLHGIQFRQYAYFGEELRAIFDNGSISEARQAISKFKAVLNELPERPTAGLLVAIQARFDQFDAAMDELGRWIADRMRVIRERRATSSA